jgi:hypothetical protein
MLSNRRGRCGERQGESCWVSLIAAGPDASEPKQESAPKTIVSRKLDMSDETPTSTRVAAESSLGRLLPLALAAGLLYTSALAFTRLPCWALPPLLVPLAWLIWAYWAGNALFARRLWLQGVTRPDSKVRRWLIGGRLLQGVTAIPALLFTGLLLPAAALLRPQHWLVLTLDVLLLSLAIGPLQRRLATEVQDDKAGFVTRRWPLLLGNLLLLAAGFLVVDLALVGGPDSRGQAWHAVAETAFAAAAEEAACPEAGWAVGALATVQALAWHASLLVVPSLPQPALRLGSWLLVLAQAGLFAWLYTSLLLGTLALVEQRRRMGAAATETGSAGTLSTTFIYTILLLALPYLYATHKLEHFDWTSLGDQAQQVIRWTNPCRTDPTLADLSGALGGRLKSIRTDALVAADAEIDAALDAFFVKAEQSVDAYLDWYFSVVGEYQRLAAAATGDFGALMVAELDQRLFGDTGFEPWLQGVYADLDADAEQRIGQLADEVGWELRSAAETSDCAFELIAGTGSADGSQALLGFSRDARRAGTAAAVAATAAVTTKLLSKQVAGAVASKLATKKGVQTAAALAGKAAAKKGGSSLASAMASGLGTAGFCALSGPWAVLCGIGVGVATWLAVDKAMVEVDEARFRNEMRADLMAALEEQRQTLATLLQQRQRAVVDARLKALAERLRRRYVPARE